MKKQVCCFALNVDVLQGKGESPNVDRGETPPATAPCQPELSNALHEQDPPQQSTRTHRESTSHTMVSTTQYITACGCFTIRKSGMRQRHCYHKVLGVCSNPVPCTMSRNVCEVCSATSMSHKGQCMLELV